MCRHAAYIGPPISLGAFALDPPHSLAVQSWKPREQLSATVNADGFGFGWYLPDGTPGVYLNPLPIWADTNLVHLGRTISSGVLVGNVRSATPGLGFGLANTHPFVADGLLFSHNGFIQDFARTMRATMRASLPPEVDATVGGNTDSEHLFACLRALARDTDDLASAVMRLHDHVGSWARDGAIAVLFNILVTDGRALYATRSSFGHASPSLYVTDADPAFPDGALVASEPLTIGGAWTPVPDRHLVVLMPGEAPQFRPL